MQSVRIAVRACRRFTSIGIALGRVLSGARHEDIEIAHGGVPRMTSHMPWIASDSRHLRGNASRKRIIASVRLLYREIANTPENIRPTAKQEQTQHFKNLEWGRSRAT